MRLKFAKMQGQGNDFVVIDGVRQSASLTAPQVRALADRHFGIGCDQVLLVEPAADPANDFRYRIWNADGGEVEQCGNGARCFARFVRDEGLTDKDAMRVETARGVIRPFLEPSGKVTVDMGPPRFEPSEIPFAAPALRTTYPLEVGGRHVELSVLSMGNPHAVQIVEDVETAPVATQGPMIESHLAFPNRVNAGFLQVMSRSHVRLRVWERGAGETLACGTGACAAVVAGIRLGLLDEEVTVLARGGALLVRWAAGARAMTPPFPPVMMTGDAVRVFEGEIDLEMLASLERHPC
jgi:diaminopimelate epimerase